VGGEGDTASSTANEVIKRCDEATMFYHVKSHVKHLSWVKGAYVPEAFIPGDFVLGAFLPGAFIPQGFPPKGHSFHGLSSLEGFILGRLVLGCFIPGVFVSGGFVLRVLFII